MSQENVKKDILNLAGEIHPKLRAMLEAGGLRFVEEQTENLAFIFLRDKKSEWKELDEKFHVLTKNIAVISFSPVSEKEEFWKYNGRAILNEQTLDDELLSKVVQRLFVLDSAVNVEYAYDKLLNKIHTFKLMTHLSLGTYLDSVASTAFELDFDVINLRSFYVNSLSYITYLQKAGIVHYPIDVQYGYSDSCFVLQYVVSAGPMYSEYLAQALAQEDAKNPLKSLLTWCEKQCDFFDIYQLENSEKLVLSGLWLKDRNLSFPSFFTNNIPSFYGERRRLTSVAQEPVYNTESVSNSSLGALQVKPLPGLGLTPMSPSFENHPETFKELIKHLALKKRNVEGDDSFAVSLENLDEHLQDYESAEVLKQLNELDKKILVSAWQDVQENKVLGVDQVLENIEKIDFYEEEEEGSTLIKGGQEEAEGSQLVRGSAQEKEAMTIIKGSRPDSDSKNHITIVKGDSHTDSKKGLFNLSKVLPNQVSDKIDKNKWRQVRGELARDLRELRNEGKDFKEIEQAFIEKVSTDIGMPQEEARLFVQGILGQMNAEASSVEVNKKLLEAKEQLNKEKAHVEVVKKETARHYGDEVKKRDQQIMKMKRIIDVMKKELDSAKKSLQSSKGNGGVAATENLKDQNAKISEDKMLLTEERHSLELNVRTLEAELNLKNKELAKRESQIQNLRDAQQKMSDRHETIIKEYQTRIQELNAAQTQSLAAKELEELHQLRQENQTMSSMLELSSKKITNLSETYDRLKKHGDDKIAGQIKNLTESKVELTAQLRQAQERELRAEGRCRSLESSVEKLQHEIDKLRESQVSQEPQGDQEKILRELKADDLNQKQMLKQSELNAKKLEQKIKFLTEQLAQAQKAASMSHKGSNGAESTKASDAKVKQLEMNLEKANISSSKIKDELAEKKKENLKLKTDLQTLQNQLQEAQRKIGVLDKKKAA